jgi:hypothetical protein
VVIVSPPGHDIVPSRHDAAVVDDISAIVEQMYGDLARYPHHPVEVVRVPLCPVPNGIPHREDGS